MDEKLAPLISAPAIAQAVVKLATEIDRTAEGDSLVVVGILKGSFMFLADLVRQIKTPISHIEFLRCSSYGSGTTSSGNVSMQLGLDPAKVQNQHLLLVEDIVDTGLTTATVYKYLQQQQPASVKLCALLDKPERRTTAVTIDYEGFQIPDHFIVGYGIDFDERYRQLPAIYILNDTTL